MSEITTVHNENKPRESNYMGYFITIILFLFGQTIAGAYWAGSISSNQQATQETVKKLEGTVDTLRNQYQVLSMQVAAMDAASKMDREKRGK